MKLCFSSIDVESESGDFQAVENLDKILALFSQFNIPLTLFVNGEVLEKHPGRVKAWARDFEIACHSFSHRFWSELSQEQREQELDRFIRVYRGLPPAKLLKGFRAPSHLIDEQALKLLEEKGFLYDSSVLPHYPFFKKYRGFQAKAPFSPYSPSPENCRKRGKERNKMKILEIPAAGQLLGIPLTGIWLIKLPFFVYRILFLLHNPSFLTLNLHSFDVLNRQFLKKLEKILTLLQQKGYQFLSGEQVYAKFFSKDRR